MEMEDWLAKLEELELQASLDSGILRESYRVISQGEQEISELTGRVEELENALKIALDSLIASYRGCDFSDSRIAKFPEIRLARAVLKINES